MFIKHQFLLIIFIAILSNNATASSFDLFKQSEGIKQDFYFSVIVNDKKIGEYKFYKIGSKLFGEKLFFNKIGVPAKKDLLVSVLNKNGGFVDVNESKQIIKIKSKYLFQQMKRVKPDLFIEAEKPILSFKKIGYSLSKSQNSDVGGMLSVSGAVGSASIDLYHSVGTSEKTDLYLETYDDKNPYLKTFRVQIPQLSNISSLYFSNRSNTASGSLDSDIIYLNQPINSTVDFFQNNKYIKTFKITEEAQPFKLDINASINRYKFVVTRPDGVIKEVLKKRDIAGQITKVSNLDYDLNTYKQDDKYNYDLRLSYGLNRYLSLTANKKSNDDLLFKGFNFGYAINNESRISASLSHADKDNFSLYSNYSNEYFFSSLSKTIRSSLESKSFRFSFRKMLLNPSFKFYDKQYSYGKTKGVETRLSQSFSIKELRSSFNTSVKFVNENLLSSTESRLTINNSLGRLRLTNLEENKNGYEFITNKAEYSKYFRSGYFNIDATKSDNQDEPRYSASLVFSNWKYARLTLSSTKEKDNYSWSIGISGTIGKDGFKKYENGSVLKIESCEDLNFNNKCEQDEPEIKGIQMGLNNNEIKATPAYLTELPSFTPVDIPLYGDIGVVTENNLIRVSGLSRNAENTIRLPFNRSIEIMGEIKSKKDGVKIKLIDVETGKVISKTTTFFNGQYLFYGIKGKKYKVEY